MNSTPVEHTINSWATRMVDSILPGYQPRSWEWHYEHGLFIQATLLAGIANREPRFIQFARKWADHFVTPEGIRTYHQADYNLDQINPGKVLLLLNTQTKSRQYEKAIHLLREQLKKQPRTSSGGFWHKLIYPYQIWLDGLYMAGPFLVEYALTFDEPDILGDVTRQMIDIEKHVRDPQTGLLYHGWDEKRIQKWADPVTGCSSQFWGRSMGWYLMAIVDVLDLVPGDHPDRSDLIGILQQLSSALLRFQDPSSGLWYQVVDQAGRPGNYRETSISAMLVYSFARAVRMGWLAPEYLPVAQRAYHGLLENMIKVDAHGALILEGTCSVGGLGGTPYRDGSYEYYISEKIFTNDFKGVGAFILAALEMEKAGVDKPA